MFRLDYRDPADGFDYFVQQMWIAVKSGPDGEDLAHVTLEDGRKLVVCPSLVSHSH